MEISSLLEFLNEKLNLWSCCLGRVGGVGGVGGTGTVPVFSLSYMDMGYAFYIFSSLLL